jgi:hypothetical protein
MSQLVGAPVRVQLMRWDELGWNQSAPGALFDIRAGVDASGWGLFRSPLLRSWDVGRMVP